MFLIIGDTISKMSRLLLDTYCFWYEDGGVKMSLELDESNL